jgi:hypothetical protein
VTTATRCQQDTVYAAQNTTFRGEPIGSIADVQRFVDDLREAWWWEKWLGDRVIRVEVGQARGFDSVGWYDEDARSGRMEFGHVPLTIGLVLHELAHVLAKARRHSQAHDPWFARIYLELSYLVRGSAAYEELRKAFDTHGVDYDAGGLA